MPFPVTFWSLINSKNKFTAEVIPQFITQIQMYEYLIVVNFFIYSSRPSILSKISLFNLLISVTKFLLISSLMMIIHAFAELLYGLSQFGLVLVNHFQIQNYCFSLATLYAVGNTCSVITFIKSLNKNSQGSLSLLLQAI
jgi:hypothetical protein